MWNSKDALQGLTSSLFLSIIKKYVLNLSAQKKTKKAETRFLGQKKNKNREKSFEQAQRKKKMAANRLKKQKNFAKVFKSGRGIKEDVLFLKFTPNNLPENRFGIIVSKKVSKKAVTRNKIKRRMRAIIRKKTTQIKQGLDVVMTALPGADKKSFAEFEKTAEELFKKSKLIEK